MLRPPHRPRATAANDALGSSPPKLPSTKPCAACAHIPLRGRPQAQQHEVRQVRHGRARPQRARVERAACRRACSGARSQLAFGRRAAAVRPALSDLQHAFTPSFRPRDVTDVTDVTDVIDVTSGHATRRACTHALTAGRPCSTFSATPLFSLHSFRSICHVRYASLRPFAPPLAACRPPVAPSTCRSRARRAPHHLRRQVPQRGGR